MEMSVDDDDGDGSHGMQQIAMQCVLNLNAFAVSEVVIFLRFCNLWQNTFRFPFCIIYTRIVYFA
jgi:hypothetical protein